MADTGIGSIISSQVAGFDAQAAVDGLLGLRKFEISQLEKKQDALTTRQDALLQINDASRALRTTAIGMSDKAGFFGYTASLSTSDAAVNASNLIDVSGTSGLASGQHSIVISQIAQAQRYSSSTAVLDNTATAAASASSVLNLTGSFLIEGASVTVSTSDSLNDIASNINQLNTGSSATGVTASVMKVADNDFRLILTDDATGATGFTLTGADLSGALANLQLATPQVLMAAQDASFTVDGLAVTRSTNTVSDVLSGVTLSLKQADAATTINITIGVDQQAIRDNVQIFIDSYNALQTLINDQFQFDPSTGVGGVLAGEGLLTSITGNMSSSLLKTVPGLASDRNSLVMVGVEPDETGQLIINETLFGNFLANDATAIRDVFVAQGSSSNNSLQFLTHGFTTPSGTYSVNVTQAATKASVTGSTDLSGGLGVATDTVTITATGSSRQAAVTLTLGQSQSEIVDALNAELSADYTEQHQLSTALIAAAAAATGSTTFSALDGVAIAASDTISISGTLRSGASVSGTYSVLDPAVDTISNLLSSIQTTFNQEVIASIDANGKISVTDVSTGDSQLTVALTANNEGGGSLAFGSDTVATEGRYAVPAVAVISGNGVAIESTSFGTGGFTITQSVDGLGIADQSAAGTDVAGTINGLAATGGGQILTGSSGDVEALAIMYTGSATGAVGDLTVGIGIAAGFDNILDLFSNPVFGLIQNSVVADQTSFDALTLKIDNLTAQMERQRILLTGQFTRMQTAMASLQQSGSFLSQNINAQNRNY